MNLESLNSFKILEITDGKALWGIIWTHVPKQDCFVRLILQCFVQTDFEKLLYDAHSQRWGRLYSVTLQCTLLQTCEKACIHTTHVCIIRMCHFSWLFRQNNHFPILMNFSHSRYWCLEVKWNLEMRALEYMNTKMIIFPGYFKGCISEFELVSISSFCSQYNVDLRTRNSQKICVGRGERPGHPFLLQPLPGW